MEPESGSKVPAGPYCTLSRIRLLEQKDRAILRLTSLLMRTDADLGAISEAVLEEAKRLTGSRYGFVGTIDQETGELLGHTLKNIKDCLLPNREPRIAPDPEGKYRSLFGHALNTKIPFYTNSPRDHPASRGTPPGHIRIDQFLAVPVMMSTYEKPLGLIALANPEKGSYDSKDLETVCYLSYYFALSLHRRFLEERLQRSEKYYRELFEGMPIPVFSVNEDGIIEKVNGTISQLLGYSKEEVEGNHWERFVHQKDLQRLKEYRRLRLSGSRDVPNSYEVTMVRKDGSPAECQLNIITVEGKRIIGALFDLTEIKRYQRELEKHANSLEKLLEEKTRELLEKERLAAIGEAALMVGHDLRNPLQAVMNMSFILRTMADGGQDPAQSGGDADCLKVKASQLLAIADSLERGINYMNKIVMDLQDLGRPLSVELTTTTLREVLEGALFGIDIPKNITLKVVVGRPDSPRQGPGPVPIPVPIPVLGQHQHPHPGPDPDLRLLLPQQLLERALKNLIINAIQAMPKGGTLTVSACVEAGTVPIKNQSAAPSTDNGMFAVFSVSDTGVGIPPEVMSSLFKPFKTTKSKGTGLGLAVVKRIVDALGGEIGVESAPEKGTTFTIRVPAKPL